LANPLHNLQKKALQKKDLGVTVSKEMKVSRQCLMAAKKGHQILGLIYRTIQNKDKDILISLYKSLVGPHPEYCIQVLCPHLKKDINQLERVQRRATKMIESIKNLS